MGLPDQPPSLRPRAWGLLLGITPPDKKKWTAARKRLRTDYIVCPCVSIPFLFRATFDVLLLFT